MEDFKNSVAHLDVEVTTDISYTAVVGENFYRFLYVSQKKGITPTLLTKDTYVDTLNKLLADDEDNLEFAKKNVSSIYEYASSARGLIISAEDYVKYKYKGYWTYVEPSYKAVMEDAYVEKAVTAEDNPQALGLYEASGTSYVPTTDATPQNVDVYTKVEPVGDEDPSALVWYEYDGTTYVLSADTTVDSAKEYFTRSTEPKKYYEKVQVVSKYELAEEFKAVLDILEEVLDKEFSQVITDLAVPYDIQDKDEKISDLTEELAKYRFTISYAARGATEKLEWKTPSTEEVAKPITVGLSPILYQLGRTIGVINTPTGTPVGNSCDTVQCAQADVLLTRSTSTEELINPPALVSTWFEDAKIQYFKTVGNGTGNMQMYGGWTNKGSCVCADWIVAYINYMTKVSIATILGNMNEFKSPQSYEKCRSAMMGNVSPFVELGRIFGAEDTAPSYGSLPKANGHTLVIPDAWSGTYRDDLRKVKIQGALTVEA